MSSVGAVVGKIRVKAIFALGAEPVREIKVLVLLEINFQMLPITAVISDFFA